MTIEALKNRLPDYAKDLRINLGVISSSTVLTPQQAWGTALAAAVTAKNREVVDAIAAEAGPHLSTEAAEAARAAAAIMGMNNIYYRFRHMVSDASGYSELPARLRMQIIAKPGVEHLDFELWCLAASAITGCETCVVSHEKSFRDKGGSAEQVQDAVRIAAVVHAVALTLSTV
jgi:alkyl hydroperoxide reductase subunit D